MRSMKLPLLAFCLISFAVGAEEGWIEDYQTAKARAAKEGKDILMDFTGSDWCHWCIQLNREVFDQPTFKAEAPKKYILLLLDFPNRKSQSKELKRQNAELAQKYGIDGYPSIILADSTGRMIGKAGYEAGGDVKYLRRLSMLKLSDAISQFMDVNDPTGANNKVDEFIKENPMEAAEKQEVLYMKAVVSSSTGDAQKTILALKAAYDADPNTRGGKRIAEIMESVKNGPPGSAKSSPAEQK